MEHSFKANSTNYLQRLQPPHCVATDATHATLSYNNAKLITVHVTSFGDENIRERGFPVAFVGSPWLPYMARMARRGQLPKLGQKTTFCPKLGHTRVLKRLPPGSGTCFCFLGFAFPCSLQKGQVVRSRNQLFVYVVLCRFLLMILTHYYSIRLKSSLYL